MADVDHQSSSASKYYNYACMSFSLLLLSSLLAPTRAQKDSPYSIIPTLPGFEGSLPFYLETGYVGVGEVSEFQLFYYFVKSERSPEKDPVILWLTGGPGCSALSGFMFEIGPLKFNNVKYDGSPPTLKLNPSSWTKVANVIFLDSPVGTGFSYVKGLQEFTMGDIKSSKLVYRFLRKWMDDHPQFLGNELYIGGDSYSGITVPIITLDIALGNNDGIKPTLNLKGYFLGNPSADQKIDYASRVPFLHGMGIIADELYEAAKEKCKGDYTDYGDMECAQALFAVFQCTIGLNTAHILEPLCSFFALKPASVAAHSRALKEELEEEPDYDVSCRSYGYLLCAYWANDYRVREALHIARGSVKEWRRCNNGITYAKDVTNAIEYHLKLTKQGFRALIYSGDHDMAHPFVGTLTWIKFMNYSIVDEWRPWFVDGQIAGYTRLYDHNLTYATIKGGGHTAPEYKPKESLNMLQRWLSYNPL